LKGRFRSIERNYRKSGKYQDFSPKTGKAGHFKKISKKAGKYGRCEPCIRHRQLPCSPSNNQHQI